MLVRYVPVHQTGYQSTVSCTWCGCPGTNNYALGHLARWAGGKSLTMPEVDIHFRWTATKILGWSSQGMRKVVTESDDACSGGSSICRYLNTYSNATWPAPQHCRTRPTTLTTTLTTTSGQHSGLDVKATGALARGGTYVLPRYPSNLTR